MNIRPEYKQSDLVEKETQNIKSIQAKTTNINILLNRVKLNKKNELKNKIFFSSLVILAVTFIGIFSLI